MSALSHLERSIDRVMSRGKRKAKTYQTKVLRSMKPISVRAEDQRFNYADIQIKRRKND